LEQIPDFKKHVTGIDKFSFKLNMGWHK